MKNKRFTFFGLALLVTGALVLTNCTKNKTNKAPEPDTDTEGARDAARATQLVVEINDIAAHVCENQTNFNQFAYVSYSPLSTSITTGTVTSVINSIDANVVNNIASKYHDVTFNNTIGKDGIIKNGSLHFNFAATTLPTGLPATYYREAGYDLKITSPTNIIWDGDTLLILNYRVFNNTPIGFPLTSPFKPSLGTKITWQITANIVIHKKDGKNIKWNGTLLRTLENTNNTSVPMPAGVTATTFTVFPSPYTLALYQWKTYCSYSGSGNGDVLSNGDSYVWSIPTDFPLTRNMNSSPQAFVAIGGVFTTPERHPFLSGVLYVDPGTKTRRKVDFGMPDVVDYDAKVTVDGITYGVDMKY